MVKEDPFEKLLKRDLVSRTTYLIMNVKSLIVSFMSTDRYRHRVARLGQISRPIWQLCAGGVFVNRADITYNIYNI